MIKNPAFQKELLEKVKPGTKPSHLKRSKSADDIVPDAPPLPEPSELEKLKKATDLNALLSEQLKEKQKEIEELRKKLEGKPETTELDQALAARHQGLKDWFSQYSKNQKLDQELTENIDQASEELVNQDQTISDLRGEVRKLKREKQSLARDLDLAQRLAQARKVPYLPTQNWDSLKYALYSLLAVGFTLWLTQTKNSHG